MCRCVLILKTMEIVLWALLLWGILTTINKEEKWEWLIFTGHSQFDDQNNLWNNIFYSITNLFSHYPINSKKS